MKKLIVAFAALAAACGSQEAKVEEAPAPTGLMEQALAMSPEESAVFAYTTFMAKAPTLPRPCPAVRETISRGVIPAEVPADSIYAPHVGSLVFAIQCGELLTTVRADPQDHYMLILPPGGTDAQIASCLTAEGIDGCRAMARPMPQPGGAPKAEEKAG